MTGQGVHILQNVLNGGEISPLMFGRFDQPRYQTGAYEMRNAVPMPQGGVTKRPGMIFCGLAQAQGADAARLVPFVYDGQHRMIELSAGNGRVWYPNGTPVPGGTFTHPYTGAELAGLRFAQSADVIFIVSPAHKPAKVSRHADDDWRFEILTFTPKTPSPGAPALAAGGSVSGIRPATRQDALRIAHLIRPEDINEWIALAPLHQSPSIATSLIFGVENGEALYACEGDGTPVAIGGLCEFYGFTSPWLMATPAIARHGKDALRQGRGKLREWKERGLPLANIVSVRHRRAVRYIRACGYEILRAFSAHGEHFFIFGVCHV